MNNKSNIAIDDVVAAVRTGRERTNILKESEQKLLVYLVQRVSSWVNSDMLTILGLLGNVLVFISFLL